MDALKEAIGPEIWALANDADNNISRQAIAVLQSINPDRAKLDQVSDNIRRNAKERFTKGMASLVT